MPKVEEFYASRDDRCICTWNQLSAPESGLRLKVLGTGDKALTELGGEEERRPVLRRDRRQGERSGTRNFCVTLKVMHRSKVPEQENRKSRSGNFESS